MPSLMDLPIPEKNCRMLDVMPYCWLMFLAVLGAATTALQKSLNWSAVWLSPNFALLSTTLRFHRLSLLVMSYCESHLSHTCDHRYPSFPVL